MMYTKTNKSAVLLGTVILSFIGNASALNSGMEELAKQLKEIVHPLWLRERCTEDFYADPDTRQPKYNLHEEVADLEVVEAKFTAGETNGFVVVFSDDQQCFYPLSMLKAEMNGEYTLMQTDEWDVPPLFIWNRTSLLAPSLFEHDEIVVEGGSVETRKFLSTLISTGIAMVANVPRVEGECERFVERFTSLRETEWGRIFNVRSTLDTLPTKPTSKNNDSAGKSETARSLKDLAYTASAIGMHVDSPYRIDTPPAYQLLHAMEHCSGEGCQVHNHFVDGFAIAETLCHSNRAYFDILTTTNLRWENNGADDSSFLSRYAPMIELADDATKDGNDEACPNVQAINFSAKSGGYAPYTTDKEHLELFYQAKRAFSNLLHNDEYTIRTQLFPGALVMFDNRRVLHSRSNIVDSDGPRWLQGCYGNRDGIHYQYESLRRRLQHLTETPFRSLKTAQKADYDRMGTEYDENIVKKTKGHLIALLESQKPVYLGQPISLYEHNVQTASRALRAGEDDETVFVALFHDVFETLAVSNHGDLVAAMLAPWISPKNHWMLAYHEIFQGFYYFHYYNEVGGDTPPRRDEYKDNPYYNWTVYFCEHYDQASFDPDYPTLPLSIFYPIIDRVLSRPQYWWNPSHPKAGAVTADFPTPAARA